jgi:CubicO group peptidase (beta-lactamase class C family)
MSKRASRAVRWVGIASAVASGIAVTPALAGPPAAEPAPVPLTAGDLGAWLDGFMPAGLARAGVAGAVVVVVKDGEVLLERGYGAADVATGAPVDPKTTLFRPGSVSKLFTWTAVMQLVEAGKLDLDADINRYLDFAIPPRDSRPITLRNLLTHTPGFEEASKALITSKPLGTTLGEELKRWVPTRVFDAGTTPAYSNYGAALAGYIVQRVSGEPFEKYVEGHIFRPLRMEHSTFEQPLPPSLAVLLSKGYRTASQPPGSFEFVSLPPAGSLSATGDDMAKFMIAHLQDGRLGDARILAAATAETMHHSRTALMAPLNGIELGFYDQDINGHRVIAHGGDTQYFHSELVLFLDDHVGLFVSLNSAGVPGASLREPLFEGFADRYFPAVSGDGAVDAKTAAEHTQMVVGRYVTARGSYTNFMAVASLIGQLSVIANPDGTISIPMLTTPSGEPRRYREIAPFLWREVGGHDRVGAIVKDGRVVRISSDLLSGVIVFDRAPPSISAAWLLPAAGAAAAVVLATVLAWPVGALLRARYRAPFPLHGRRRNAHRVAWLAALVMLLSIVGWTSLLALAFGHDGLEALAQNDTLLLLVQAITVLGTCGGVLAAIYNLLAVWGHPSGWFAKLWNVLLTASFAVLLWFAVAGHLLKLSAQY